MTVNEETSSAGFFLNSKDDVNNIKKIVDTFFMLW